MKIISIHRNISDLEIDIPEIFTIGAVPQVDDGPVDDNPVVESIKFYETGFAKGQAYRGPCYVISFVDSHIKRIIPADTIKEIAVEMDAEKNKKDQTKKADEAQIEATA